MNINKKISLLVIAFGMIILLDTAFMLGLEVNNGFSFGFDFLFNSDKIKLGSIYRQQFVTYSLSLLSIIGALFMHMGYNLYKE